MHWVSISLWAISASAFHQRWMNPKSAWVRVEFKHSIAPQVAWMEDQVRRNSGKQPWNLERKQTENGNIEKWTQNSTIPMFFLFSFLFLSCASRCNCLSRVLVTLLWVLFFLRLLVRSPFFTLWTAPDETTVHLALRVETRRAIPNCSRRQTYHTLFPFDPSLLATESNREKCSVVDSSLRLAFVCVLKHTTTLAHRYRGALAP